MAQIEILQGDITEADVEAVVNAAKNEPQVGGEVTRGIRGKGECKDFPTRLPEFIVRR